MKAENNKLKRKGDYYILIYPTKCFAFKMTKLAWAGTLITEIS